jgi:FixJ family two-component response regulator
MKIVEKTDAKISLHFVEQSSQQRAEMVRIGSSIGHHCEIYSDFSELAAYPPRSGIIFIRDNVGSGGISFASERLFNLGISLPIVAMDEAPSPGRVVQAVKEGALDYLALPLKIERLEACLARIGKEAERVTQTRERAIVAQGRLATLSHREREVLDALALGCANKEIARQLQISPRTVEIHRANMMNKLGARHAVQAITLKMEAKFGASVPA